MNTKVMLGVGAVATIAAYFAVGTAAAIFVGVVCLLVIGNMLMGGGKKEDKPAPLAKTEGQGGGDPAAGGGQPGQSGQARQGEGRVHVKSEAAIFRDNGDMSDEAIVAALGNPQLDDRVRESLHAVMFVRAQKELARFGIKLTPPDSLVPTRNNEPEDKRIIKINPRRR